MLYHSLKREDLGDGRTRVSGQCFGSTKQHEVVVSTEGLKLWEAGAKLQDALPDVPPADREFLKTATDPDLFAPPGGPATTITIELGGVVATVTKHEDGIVVHFARQEDSSDLAQITVMPEIESLRVVTYGEAVASVEAGR